MPPSKAGRNPLVRALLPTGSRRRRLVATTVRRVGVLRRSAQPPAKVAPARGKVAQPQKAKAPASQREEENLRAMWARHRAEMLDVYLVSGYQDPRLNAQSILGRHTLVRALFGDEFDALMREELEHAVELNEAIRRRADELGVTLSSTLDTERQAGVQKVMEAVAETAPLFAQRWQDALNGRQAPPLRVVEFACGSANDYRAFAEYGIARLLDYTGIDLSTKNVANAKRRFPDVDFRVGSILSLPDDLGPVDYVIGYDILEHLSLQAMDTVLDGAERIARRGLYFAFFRMDEVPEHQEEPRKKYHFNLLSAQRMREHMERRYTSVQLVHVPTMLKHEFGYQHSYNKRAYSLIAEGPR